MVGGGESGRRGEREAKGTIPPRDSRQSEDNEYGYFMNAGGE